MANSRASRKFTRIALALLFVVLALLVLRRLADNHLRAASLLLLFENPKAHGLAVSFAEHPFREVTETALTPQGPLKFRLYLPQGADHPPAIVLLHGIHNLGIEEPRLVAFARAAAGAGVAVMTPELQDLADYRVTPQTIDTIGQAAAILSTRMQEKIGIMGMSFAGGLALLAAARPEYAPHIGFVVAVGAHDDMARVARFFADNVVERPDGSKAPFEAHEYGMLVLVYTHLDHFFAANDIPAAREALRLWLWESPQAALKAAQNLSPQGQTEFDQVIHHRQDLRPQLEEEIKAHADEMEAVSPHGHLSQLQVPVFLLHGAGDNVIPPAETEWLAKDVPARDLKKVLISPALIHVNMPDSVPWSQEWELIDFMARVLGAANELRTR